MSTPISKKLIEVSISLEAINKTGTREKSIGMAIPWRCICGGRGAVSGMPRSAAAW
jgi:hypothetical protein